METIVPRAKGGFVKGKVVSVLDLEERRCPLAPVSGAALSGGSSSSASGIHSISMLSVRVGGGLAGKRRLPSSRIACPAALAGRQVVADNDNHAEPASTPAASLLLEISESDLNQCSMMSSEAIRFQRGDRVLVPSPHTGRLLLGTVQSSTLEKDYPCALDTSVKHAQMVVTVLVSPEHATDQEKGTLRVAAALAGRLPAIEAAATTNKRASAATDPTTVHNSSTSSFSSSSLSSNTTSLMSSSANASVPSSSAASQAGDAVDSQAAATLEKKTHVLASDESILAPLATAVSRLQCQMSSTLAASLREKNAAGDSAVFVVPGDAFADDPEYSSTPLYSSIAKPSLPSTMPISVQEVEQHYALINTHQQQRQVAPLFPPPRTVTTSSSSFTAAASQPSRTTPDPKSPNWSRHESKSNPGKFYWFNKKTNVRVWEEQ